MIITQNMHTTILVNNIRPWKKSQPQPIGNIHSLPITIFSGTRLSSFTKFKPKQRNIQCHLTATVLRGQRGVAVHWAASIEGEKDKQVFEKWWQKSQRSGRKLQFEWLLLFEMCPVFSEVIWRYSKNAGAATSTGHVFVYWTTSNATLTSVNRAGWHVSWGKFTSGIQGRRVPYWWSLVWLEVLKVIFPLH